LRLNGFGDPLLAARSCSEMSERQRFLALLEIYDEAIEELYVQGDRRFVDVILRLERRRRDVERQLAEVST